MTTSRKVSRLLWIRKRCGCNDSINKESLHAAEVDLLLLAEIFWRLNRHSGSAYNVQRKGTFLTRHKSLERHADDIKKDRIIDYVERCTDALRRLGVKECGTMAAAGLNPHSASTGSFGWEEVRKVPAVEELKREDLMPGTGFLHQNQAAQGRFNSPISLYHDQGHIATKTLTLTYH